MAMTQLPKLLNLADAAAVVSVSAKTLRRWIHQGKIAASLVEGRYKISEETLMEKITNGAVQAQGR